MITIKDKFAAVDSILAADGLDIRAKETRQAIFAWMAIEAFSLTSLEELYLEMATNKGDWPTDEKTGKPIAERKARTTENSTWARAWYAFKTTMRRHCIIDKTEDGELFIRENADSDGYEPKPETVKGADEKRNDKPSIAATMAKSTADAIKAAAAKGVVAIRQQVALFLLKSYPGMKIEDIAQLECTQEQLEALKHEADQKVTEAKAARK